MESVPSVMHAWQYHQHGDPEEVLKFEESKVPQPSPSQALIKVKCAALNPAGWKTMKHLPSLLVKKPSIAEMDVSGTVVSVGNQVTAFKTGDEVFGIIPAEVLFKTGYGALAEYTVLEQEHLNVKPQNVSWQEAAATPLVALTALESLKFGNISPGKRVFVNGGSGGVGTAAIQIAKSYGAIVVVSCSNENAELVKRLGADEAVDYKSVDLPTHLAEKYGAQKFDIIVDGIGAAGSNPLFNKSPDYLNEDGTFIQIGAPMSGVIDLAKTFSTIAANTLLPTFLGGINRKFKFLGMKPSIENVSKIGELVNEGKLRLPIDSTYSFADTIKAYDRIRSNRAKGKVVVNVSD